jgi:hypothetical protein
VRRIAILLAVLVAGLVLAGSVLAATEVPKITNLRATPSTFRAKTGTTIRFTVSTNAKVRGDIRPRFENTGSFVEFVKQLHKGANSVRIQDSRLRPGRWTFRVQGTNNVGSGGIAITDVHVVK